MYDTESSTVTQHGAVCRRALRQRAHQEDRLVKRWERQDSARLRRSSNHVTVQEELAEALVPETEDDDCDGLFWEPCEHSSANGGVIYSTATAGFYAPDHGRHPSPASAPYRYAGGFVSVRTRRNTYWR